MLWRASACRTGGSAYRASTSSEIARQIVRAMLHSQIKIFYVTHMYDLAHGFHAQQPGNSLFLRAGREPDGRRTFKLAEDEPLPTSYGKESYQRIFGTLEPAPATAAGSGR